MILLPPHPPPYIHISCGKFKMAANVYLSIFNKEGRYVMILFQSIQNSLFQDLWSIISKREKQKLAEFAHHTINHHFFIQPYHNCLNSHNPLYYKPIGCSCVPFGISRKKIYTETKKKPQPFWFLGGFGQFQMVHFCLLASSITTNSIIKEKTAKPNSMAQMLPEVSSDIREH